MFIYSYSDDGYLKLVQLSGEEYVVIFFNETPDEMGIYFGAGNDYYSIMPHHANWERIKDKELKIGDKTIYIKNYPEGVAVWDNINGVFIRRIGDMLDYRNFFDLADTVGYTLEHPIELPPALHKTLNTQDDNNENVQYADKKEALLSLLSYNYSLSIDTFLPLILEANYGATDVAVRKRIYDEYTRKQHKITFDEYNAFLNDPRTARIAANMIRITAGEEAAKIFLQKLEQARNGKWQISEAFVDLAKEFVVSPNGWPITDLEAKLLAKTSPILTTDDILAMLNSEYDVVSDLKIMAAFAPEAKEVLERIESGVFIEHNRLLGL